MLNCLVMIGMIGFVFRGNGLILFVRRRIIRLILYDLIWLVIHM